MASPKQAGHNFDTEMALSAQDAPAISSTSMEVANIQTTATPNDAINEIVESAVIPEIDSTPPVPQAMHNTK